MTPDKDGWYYWNPGDPWPPQHAIYDVWTRDGDHTIWQQIADVDGSPNWWAVSKYRYRLRSQPDLSDIRPGDTVTLKPGPYVVPYMPSYKGLVVIGLEGGAVEIADQLIATHTPLSAKKSPVTDAMIDAFRRPLSTLDMSDECIRVGIEAVLAEWKKSNE